LAVRKREPGEGGYLPEYLKGSADSQRLVHGLETSGRPFKRKGPSFPTISSRGKKGRGLAQEGEITASTSSLAHDLRNREGGR